MKFLITPSVAALLLFSSSFAAKLQDDFSDPSLELRQAQRGEWQIADGVARCVSDPELYKKFNNHGPILRWPCAMQDGTVELEFRSEGSSRVVVNLNNEIGHIFRVSLGDSRRTGLFGWIGRSKETTAIPLASEGVPTLESLGDQWVKLTLNFKGDTCQFRLGEHAINISHACLLREKGELTIGFVDGTVSVRNVRAL